MWPTDMDPRLARTHATVMAAATELLVEGGPDALTVENVVARSGVARSTIYRHWSTRDDLVAEVFDTCAPHLELPDLAHGFEPSLRQLVRGFVGALGDERWRRLVPALLTLRLEHPELANIDTRMKQEQHDILDQVLRLGVAEGTLPKSVLRDIDRTATLLIGPIVMASLTETVPVDRRLADDAVDQFLAAHRRT